MLITVCGGYVLGKSVCSFETDVPCVVGTSVRKRAKRFSEEEAAEFIASFVGVKYAPELKVVPDNHFWRRK